MGGIVGRVGGGGGMRGLPLFGKCLVLLVWDREFHQTRIIATAPVLPCRVVLALVQGIKANNEVAKLHLCSVSHEEEGRQLFAHEWPPPSTVPRRVHTPLFWRHSILELEGAIQGI